MCCWHETNQYLVSKQGRKQITRKQNTGTMTRSKSAANALGLTKQDNTNRTCAADVEQIIIWLANNAVNKITEKMTCSKWTANASGSYKRNDTNGVCRWRWTDHYVVETYAMTSKFLASYSVSSSLPRKAFSLMVASNCQLFHLSWSLRKLSYANVKESYSRITTMVIVTALRKVLCFRYETATAITLSNSSNNNNDSIKVNINIK